MNTALPADHALLADYVHRSDGGAFSQLVDRHGPLVIGVCRNVLSRHHDAEDAAQATFLTLARKADSLLGHPSLAGWLHTVAWHISMRARQARQLRVQREHREDDSPAVEHDALVAAERSLQLHTAVANLPEKHRLPIVLHHFEGWSEAEVAELLGAKVGTVSGRLSRGRAMLRDKLSRSNLAVAFVPGALWHNGSNELNAALAGKLAAPAVRVSPMVAGLTDAAVHSLNRQAMWRWMIAIAVIMVVVGATAAGAWAVIRSQRAAPAALMADRAAGWVSGTLTGPSGGPVESAVVYLYHSLDDAQKRQNIVETTSTKADGKFRLENLTQKPKYFLVIGIRHYGEAPPKANFKFTYESSAVVEHELVMIQTRRRN
jgi:RNA polymerase sigma factor (sigma-70 family)